jgi:hypothetical protein
MRKSKNNVIDLSKKNPDEIHEFLQALLDLKYKLNKNNSFIDSDFFHIKKI